MNERYSRKKDEVKEAEVWLMNTIGKDVGEIIVY